jgi:hypothetical protein
MSLLDRIANALNAAGYGARSSVNARSGRTSLSTLLEGGPPNTLNGPPHVVVNIHRASNGMIVEMVRYVKSQHGGMDTTTMRHIITEPDATKLAEAITLLYVKGEIGVGD